MRENFKKNLVCKYFLYNFLMLHYNKFATLCLLIFLEFTSSQLQDYFKLCQLSYKKAFIRSIFHSLQLGYYVSTEDLKASINLCHKNVITIDISVIIIHFNTYYY